MAVTDELRESVKKSLPEAEDIRDEDLRRRVIEAWALALSESEFRSIDEIPASGNPDTPVLTGGTQSEHLRGVARLALAMLDSLEEMFGPLGVNRDHLLAGGLCHDLGKPFEFSFANQRRWRADPAQQGFPAVRHSVYGVHVALSAGLPLEIAHVAGAHSAEGELIERSLVNTIIHFADKAFWRILDKAGKLGAPREY